MNNICSLATSKLQNENLFEANYDQAMLEKSPFHKEIKLLIDTIISEFKTDLQYFYCLDTEGHFFKLDDCKIWSSDAFQQYKVSAFFELLDNGFYEGFAFFAPDDDTISFDKATRYGCGGIDNG